MRMLREIARVIDASECNLGGGELFGQRGFVRCCEYRRHSRVGFSAAVDAIDIAGEITIERKGLVLQHVFGQHAGLRKRAENSDSLCHICLAIPGRFA